MNIKDPFQLNNWKTTKLLSIVLVIQFLILVLIGLELIGIKIPLLRQIIGFVYLTFIPGILILRLLKINLSSIENVLLVIGLSLSVLMFSGLFINLIYPIIGIKKPIEIIPILITISILIISLSILCLLKNEEKIQKKYIEFEFSQVISLCIIPFLAVIGTYLMNYYHINIILEFLIIIIGLLVLLVAFNKIPKNLYPLTIFIISLSLLYHSSLISTQLWGFDIQIESFISNQILTKGIWDINIPDNVNAMLSITTLAPIYSIILNSNITWIFKIIYPFLFSLVPLGLYRIFQSQTNEKIAFLSTAFFIFFFGFFTEMLQLARQEIAELFLVLMILLLVSERRNRKIKSIFFVIFSFSLAISHYGISYIFILLLILVFLTFNIIEMNKSKISAIKDNLMSFIYDKQYISVDFVLIFIVFTIIWYIQVSSSNTFNTIVNIGDHILMNIFTDFMNPGTAQGLNIIQSETATSLHFIGKILQIMPQFLIIVGIIGLVFKKDKMKFNLIYLLFSIFCFLILVASIAVPYFSSSLNTSRVYQISLIFLAPFAVLGSLYLINMFKKVYSINIKEKTILKLFSIFLVVFLFFNTGFIYEITGDLPTSFALNKNYDEPVFNNMEFVGANWLHKSKNNNDYVYSDDYRVLLFKEFENFNSLSLTDDIIYLNSSYTYLGTFNILNNKLRNSGDKSAYSNLEPLIKDKNKIYDNGGFYIYR